MGLLRLMGNKADVVKGLAKRCNENWSIAPKSDIVSFIWGAGGRLTDNSALIGALSL
jgi:Mg2+ and Co2+ transporter CorA